MVTTTAGSRGATAQPGAGALTPRQVRQLQERMGGPFDKLPYHAAFTALMRHGGLPILLDQAAAV